MKRYLIDGKLYSFKILEVYPLHGEYEGEICYWAKCFQNGKFAWLDEYNGVQFEGEERVIAEPCTEHPNHGPYTLWGGELRPRYNWQNSPINQRY